MTKQNRKVSIMSGSSDRRLRREIRKQLHTKSKELRYATAINFQHYVNSLSFGKRLELCWKIISRRVSSLPATIETKQAAPSTGPSDGGA